MTADLHTTAWRNLASLTRAIVEKRSPEIIERLKVAEDKSWNEYWAAKELEQTV